MNHDAIRARLHDHVDRALPPEDERRVALHLRECADCAAEVDALLALRAAAQDLPPGIDPPADLWAGIESRLDEPVAVAEAAPPASPRAGRPVRLVWAVAAVLAVVLIWPRGGDQPAGDGEFAELDRTYETIRSDGRRAIDDEDGTIVATGDAEARAALDDGMTIIDEAIRETRAALEAAAETPDQLRHLAAGYQRKLDLLQRLVRTAARN